MAAVTAIFLFLTGIFGGALNAMAGGAMLFTFPALMLTGLPPIVAGASNHLALLPANAAPLPAYLDELRDAGRALIPLVATALAGALVGSLLLLGSSEAVFTGLVPLLILAATLLFAFGERVRASLVARLSAGSASRLLYAALFAACVYGGYFGAGLGIVLLGLFQVMGYASFHAANAVKNLVLVALTVLSLSVFGLGGLIAWPEATVMMAGAILGGYGAGRYAKRLDEGVIRTGVTGFGAVLTCIYVWRFWLS